MFPSKTVVDVMIAQKEHLATEIANHQYARYSQEWSLTKASHFQKSVRDVSYHLDYLTEAIAAGQTALFEDYISWAKALFAGLEFPDSVLPETLDSMRSVLKSSLPKESHAMIDRYILAGMAQCTTAPEQPPCYLTASSAISQLAQDYLNALLAGKRHEASKLILDAVNQGISVKSIYLDVFQQSQREIGRLWQINEISVAEEHYCTAATQLIMSQLYPHIFSTERIGRRMLATSIGGELHEIGIRMVADFFEMEGWDTYFLGANSPTETILQTIEEKKPDILAISATITSHVSQVERLITAVKAQQINFTPRIMVGGYPFNVAPNLWQKIGADGFGRDAEEALSMSKNLLSV
ncbi:MAG: cobalamin-dependent protein [Chloroflexi bacterium]|nr:cobalamin-dependent protein [Chloroflexota bacterium]